MPTIPTGGSTGVYSDSGMYSAEPPAAASALTGPTILPTEIPGSALGDIAPAIDTVVDPATGVMDIAPATDAVVDSATYSADLLFDERLVLLPSFDATQPAFVVLTGDKISDSAAETGVIDTGVFEYDGSQLTSCLTYCF